MRRSSQLQSCTWPPSYIICCSRLFQITQPVRRSLYRTFLLCLFLTRSAHIDRFFNYFFPAMHFNYISDLPVSFPLKFNDINTISIPSHTTLSLSPMSMGTNNNGGTRTQPFPPITIVAQALEIARDSPEGARDPTIINILETALTDIWRKIEAHPTSYVMTRDEFAVFNYFQERFAGQELAIAARKRYWDHLELQNEC
jgi:hypothetical protein